MIHSAPSSASSPFPSSTDRTLPPTRSRASSTTTESPGVVQVEGGGQPREPGPDDHHISHVSARSALDWLA